MKNIAVIIIGASGFTFLWLGVADILLGVKIGHLELMIGILILLAGAYLYGKKL